RAGLFFAADHAQLHAPHDHVDRSMGDVHPEGNPHVHLSPDQLPEIARALAKRLGEIEPERVAAIQGRYIRWRGDGNGLRAEWQVRGEALRGQSLVVQHSKFGYLWRCVGGEAAADLEQKPGVATSDSLL